MPILIWVKSANLQELACSPRASRNQIQMRKIPLCVHKEVVVWGFLLPTSFLRP